MPILFDDVERQVIHFLHSEWKNGQRVVTGDEVKRFMDRIGHPESLHTVHERLEHHGLVEDIDVREVRNSGPEPRERLLDGWRINPALCDVADELTVGTTCPTIDKPPVDWLHDAGSEPPADFYRDKWLTGTQTEIGFAIRPANQPPVKSVVALRDYLARIASAKNSRVWCRATGTKQIDAFVRDPKPLHAAEDRLVTYRAAKPKKVKATQRKSVPKKGR